MKKGDKILLGIVAVIVILVISNQQTPLKQADATSGSLKHMNGRYDSNIVADREKLSWGSVFSSTATFGEYELVTSKTGRMDYCDEACKTLPGDAVSIFELGEDADGCMHWNYQQCSNRCEWDILPGCTQISRIPGCSGMSQQCCSDTTDFGGIQQVNCQDIKACSWMADLYKNGVLIDSHDWNYRADITYSDDTVDIQYNSNRYFLYTDFCVRVESTIDYHLPSDFDVTFDSYGVKIINNWKPLNAEMELNYVGGPEISDHFVPLGETFIPYDADVTDIEISPSLTVYEPVSNFEGVNGACAGVPVRDIKDCSRVELDTVTGASIIPRTIRNIAGNYVTGLIGIQEAITQANEWVEQ